MIIHFKKKMKCGSKNHQTCSENFHKKVYDLCPSIIPSVNNHITILHSHPYHEIWCTFYTTGKHEDQTPNGIVYTKFNEMQKKWEGILPTKAQLENL